MTYPLDISTQGKMTQHKQAARKRLDDVPLFIL